MKKIARITRLKTYNSVVRRLILHIVPENSAFDSIQAKKNSAITNTDVKAGEKVKGWSNKLLHVITKLIQHFTGSESKS